MHLVNGTGNSPSPGRPTLGVVKQDKSSRGSIDTTKTCSDPQRVRMSSGERPIGAAKGKQSDTEALCQPPPFSYGVQPFKHFPADGMGWSLQAVWLGHGVIKRRCRGGLWRVVDGRRPPKITLAFITVTVGGKGGGGCTGRYTGVPTGRAKGHLCRPFGWKGAPDSPPTVL